MKLEKEESGLKSVHGWRENVFGIVAGIMTNPHIPTVQKQIGIWHWNLGIPLPDRKSLLIMGESGTMSFRTNIDGHELFFSIFMFLGEVRLGFRIPNAILDRHADIKEILAHCYDGVRCPRVVEGDDAVFFDWIFKDRGMASTALMARAIEDKVASALIADAIANAMLHIYMSVMNVVLEKGNYSLAPDVGVLANEKATHLMFDVAGSLELFEVRIESSSVRILQKIPQTQSRSLYLAAAPTQEDADAFLLGLKDEDIDVTMNVCAGVEAL